MLRYDTYYISSSYVGSSWFVPHWCEEYGGKEVAVGDMVTGGSGSVVSVGSCGMMMMRMMMRMMSSSVISSNVITSCITCIIIGMII